MIARVLGTLGAMALAATLGFVPAPAATDAPMPAAAVAEPPTARVQAAVLHAFGEVLPDQETRFVLDTAKVSPVEGGGQRFDGFGIGTFDAGQAQLVAFTLTLSARGELVEFDYNTASPDEPAGQIAAY